MVSNFVFSYHLLLSLVPLDSGEFYLLLWYLFPPKLLFYLIIFIIQS
jgi:hypothetical protein